jgi:hypothetical protein
MLRDPKRDTSRLGTLVLRNEVKHLGHEYDQRLLSCSGRESDKNADPIWPASKHSAYFG